jgi:hypothetical protein
LINQPRREKHTIERAVSTVQKATASMGKYDKEAADQPKIKRKPVYLPDDVTQEHVISKKIIDSVLRGQEKIDINKAANLELAREQRNPKKRMRKS